MRVSADQAAQYLEGERRFASAQGLDLEERYLTLPAPVERVRVLESGSGDPVLFVHGGGGLAAHWFPLMARLSRGRMLAVDRPGCGMTNGFSYDGLPDLRSHATSFLGGVLDELSIDRVDIVANSMGGLWSLWFALDEPERVRSIALLGCPAVVVGTTAPLALRLISRAGFNKMMQRPATPKSMRQVMKMMGHPADFDRLIGDEFLVASALGDNLPGAGASFVSLVRRVSRLRGAVPDCRLDEPELARLSVRPLVVWGPHDAFGDEKAARRFAKATGGNLNFAGVGHLPWLDDPDGVASLVQSHLDSGMAAT